MRLRPVRETKQRAGAERDDCKQEYVRKTRFHCWPEEQRRSQLWIRGITLYGRVSWREFRRPGAGQNESRFGTRLSAKTRRRCRIAPNSIEKTRMTRSLGARRRPCSVKEHRWSIKGRRVRCYITRAHFGQARMWNPLIETRTMLPDSSSAPSRLVRSTVSDCRLCLEEGSR